MGDEEWTFVPQRKGSKHSKNKNQHNNRKEGKHTVSGLYGTSVHNNDDTTEHENSTSTDEQKLIERERIKHNVLKCVDALENQIQMDNDLFAHRLISSLAVASSTTNTNNELQSNNTTIKDDKSVGSTLHIREIVAYGIGNFAKGNYQASTLQLACLLLIRRRAAFAKQHSTTMIDTNDQSSKSTSDDTATTINSFEYDQKQVPIYYYEPCILPIEKELLESMFHIYVLTSNEFGKRSVESMRQELIQQRQQQPSSSTNTVPSNTSTTAAVSDFSDVDTECLHTLFYMPHCPMQLYSNVLWAHWDYIFPRQQQKCTKHSTTDDNNTPSTVPSSHVNSINNSIVIFGNSFHAYDDRTISSEKRMNPSNGLYRVIPFINETIVSVQPRDCRGEDAVDALRYLDNTFNDCNVMSFSCNGDDGAGCREKKIMPERPKEWFASDDPDNNGELI